MTAPARFGGLESVVAALAAGLAARNHRVRLVSLLGPGPDDRCEPFERLGERGVEVREIRLPPRSYRAERRRVAALLREPGLAHCHGYHADLVGGSAARAAGCPAVSTVHGFTGGGWKNRLYEWLDVRALARFDAVIAVSAPLRKQLVRRGVAVGRVHLLPNAWAPGGPPLTRAAARLELGLPPDAIVAGWVGRLTAEKGPDLFVDALVRLPAGVHGSVIGDGPMRAGLEERARVAGAGSRLHWHGLRPAAARLLPAFDLLVLSSRTEGTPITLLEAMAAGVPVVTTAVGGIPDVVTDEHALLVPSPNAAAVAAGVERCLADPVAAASRAAAARTRLDRAFGLEPWLDRHEQLYRSLG